MLRRGIATASSGASKWALKGPIPLIINGKDVTTEASFPVISPKTNTQVWTASSVSVQGAIKAADVAKDAFPVWSKSKPHVRRDILLKAADIMVRRKEELGYYMEQEIGANAIYKDFILGLTIEHLRDTAGRIAGAVTGTLPDSFHDGMKAMVQKKPYGVILGIAPW
jgi:acyl-CoA reductase-like NAD-dependent aldehyde dehydrogenase